MIVLTNVISVLPLLDVYSVEKVMDTTKINAKPVPLKMICWSGVMEISLKFLCVVPDTELLMTPYLVLAVLTTA